MFRPSPMASTFSASVALWAAVAAGGCSAGEPSTPINASSAEARAAATRAMVIVALDGESDHGQVDWAAVEDTRRCVANPRLTCHVVLPLKDASYARLKRDCRRHARCELHTFSTDEDILKELEGLNGKVQVGLLIGHHTGTGLWDHPDLTPKALEDATTYPLVLRICNGADFAEGADGGLVAVSDGYLAVSDATHADVVRRILEEADRASSADAGTDGSR